MSDIVSSDGLVVSVDNLIRDITDWQLISYLTVASTALIFHDWLVTSDVEFDFVWHRGRNRYVQILFLGARYAALASAILYWFLAAADVADIVILSLLRAIAIICSELIFATRAWAIWERSRPILLFLIGLIVFVAALGTTTAEFTSDVLITSRFPLILDDVGLYQITIAATKYPWAVSIPNLLILVYQSVVLALTLYKVLQYQRYIPKQSRSTVVNVFWIDGVMYYVFMFIIGVLNTGLTLKFSHRDIRPSLGQFQTVLHSVLSTRVVLHTATMLEKEIVDSRATSAQNQVSNPIRFAEVMSGAASGDVELRETLTSIIIA